MESTSCTYFCVIGFRFGYCGIQELRNGRKKLIFSVWDEKENTAEDRQVKVLEHGDGVEVSRFGGEGTGIKTMMPYDWSIGEPIKFKVSADKDCNENWTIFTCCIFHKQKDDWFQIAKLKTLTSGILLRGVYSFVEDFSRNNESFHGRRSARFGACSADHTSGETIMCRKAMFTASKSEAKNINAACCEGKFVLETGGDVQNTGHKLKEFVCIWTKETGKLERILVSTFSSFPWVRHCGLSWSFSLLFMHFHLNMDDCTVTLKIKNSWCGKLILC